MGQKVSPTGLRIGINKDWESKWYAENDFAKYLNNDYKIRKYLNKKFKNANISKIIIERNAKRCEIFVYAAKPGLIIGQSGVEIEKIKKEVSKLAHEDVQISVVEIKNPDMVAELVAQNQIDSFQAGGGREGLNFHQIGKMEFLYPGIEEQQKIGQYFANLDHLITLHQRKCDELQSIKKFMLQNMFI